MVDCKINPNAVREKYQLPLKWCLPRAHFLGADFLSSITYSKNVFGYFDIRFDFS